MAAENKQSGNGQILENVQKPLNPDILLGQLYNRDPKLFWFLNKPEKIQIGWCREISWDCLREHKTEYSLPGPPLDMDVVVQTISSNSETRLNEDSYLAINLSDRNYRHRSLLAVIDGASSQLPIKALAEHGVSGAFYISHLISHGFPQSELYENLCKKEDLSAKEVVVAINGWVREQMENIEGVDYGDAATVPGAAATFVVTDFDKNIISIAHVADTVAILNDVNGARVLTDNKNKVFDDETMKLVDKIMVEEGVSRNVAAKDPRVSEQLRVSFRKKINTQNGCGILNGMPELADNNLIQEETIDLEKMLNKEGETTAFEDWGLRLVLASDGFHTFFPKNNDGNINASLICDFVFGPGTEYGKEGDINEVREKFLNDPLFEKMPRLKIVDDITFMGLDIVFNRDEVTREHGTYPYGGNLRTAFPVSYNHNH